MNLKKSPITGNYSVIDNIYLQGYHTYSVCTESGYFKADGIDLPNDDLFVVDDDGVTWSPIYLQDGSYELRLANYAQKMNWEVLREFEVIMEVPKEEFQRAFQEYMRLIND
jgi:hypothetical protein